MECFGDLNKIISLYKFQNIEYYASLELWFSSTLKRSWIKMKNQNVTSSIWIIEGWTLWLVLRLICKLDDAYVYVFEWWGQGADNVYFAWYKWLESLDMSVVIDQFLNERLLK